MCCRSARSFAGLAFKNFFIGHDAGEFWRTSLFFGANNHILHEMHEIPEWVGIAPFLMMLGGFVVALYMYVFAPETPARLAARFNPLYKFLLNKWYFDELYDFLFVRPAFWLGRLFWKGGDGRDHRPARPGRRRGARARRHQLDRQAADRLHL